MVDPTGSADRVRKDKTPVSPDSIGIKVKVRRTQAD